MEKERYPVGFSANKHFFEFKSIGPQGTIVKRVQFESIRTEDQLFNLAFGDVDPKTNELNDLVVSNNGDAEKVLITVFTVVEIFFEENPNAILYVTGSTNSRSRLYQMGISRNLATAQEKFFILGETEQGWEPFKISSVYAAFLVRKIN